MTKTPSRVIGTTTRRRTTGERILVGILVGIVVMRATAEQIKFVVVSARFGEVN